MALAQSTAGLRVFRRLDPKLTTPAFKSFIRDNEGGNPEFLDGEVARDYIWTDEIVDSTVSFAVVGQGGDVLAEFKTLDAAEKAKASAKVVFDVQLDDVDDDDD
jgi:hypothetical protein